MNKVLLGASSLVFVALATAAGCRSGQVLAEAPLATGQVGIVAMASDASHLYWTMGSGEVRRVSLDGGEVETLATSHFGPSSIALDADNVYWIDGASDVSRVAKQGGPVTLIAMVPGVSGLAVDDDNVYFTTSDSILSVPKTAAEMVPQTLASNLYFPHSLSVTGSLIWATGIPTAHPDALPAADQANDSVASLPLKGGQPVNLVSQVAPAALSVAASHLVWTESASNTVRTAAVDGSNLKDLGIIPVVTNARQELIDAVINDDQNVYFTSDGGALRVVPVAGGQEPQVLLQGPIGLVRMTQDSTAVYAANDHEGSIVVLHKTAALVQNSGPVDPNGTPVPNPTTTATE